MSRVLSATDAVALSRCAVARRARRSRSASHAIPHTGRSLVEPALPSKRTRLKGAPMSLNPLKTPAIRTRTIAQKTPAICTLLNSRRAIERR